jgi:tRNA(Ile)-lysidine synthase
VSLIPRSAVTAGLGALAGAAGFEPMPHIAVAVSGGADSMALILLAARWARARGGRATALIVDHGLRPGSAAEARRVAGWLDRHDIDRRVLTWRGDKPASGVQAAARDARYALMTAWCRRHSVLHLLVGHHREDQAETFILRLDRGSGPDGLAAMPMVAETPWLRIVRPFLGLGRAELREFLAAEGQDWIEDPSNRDAAFARVRVRRALAVLDAGHDGDDTLARRLAGAASRLGRARHALERATAALLARSVTIYPTGHAMVDMAAIAAAPADLSLRALSRIVTCIGGRAHGPRLERLERLHARMAEDGPRRGTTLGGCLLSPARGGGVLVAREPQAIRERVVVRAPGETLWDGRFRVTVGAVGSARRAPLVVAALGSDGWASIAERRPSLRQIAIPGGVRHGLPALWSGGRVVAVPHLGYRAGAPAGRAEIRSQARFWPRRPLAGAEFSVV